VDGALTVTLSDAAVHGHVQGAQPAGVEPVHRRSGLPASSVHFQSIN